MNILRWWTANPTVQDDKNVWLRLQIGAFGANRKKKTPVFPFCWKHRGFTCPGQDRLTKKETVFRLSLWCARRDLKPCYVNRFSFDRLARTGLLPRLDDHLATCIPKTAFVSFATFCAHRLPQADSPPTISSSYYPRSSRQNVWLKLSYIGKFPLIHTKSKPPTERYIIRHH